MYRFRNWLRPPAFEDDIDKTITAGLLNSILLTTLIGPIVFSIAAVINQRNLTLSLIINAVTVFFLGSLLFVLHKGYVKQAVVGTIATMFTVFSLVAAMNNGVGSPAFSGILLVVMIAGLLLGKRFAYATAFSGASIGLLLLILNQADLIPFSNVFTFPESSTWIILSVFLSVSAVFVGMSRSMTNKALAEAEQLLVEQQEAQEALRESEETIRVLLEVFPDIIFRIDRSGTFVDYIPAKDFDTLVPPEEFLGKKLEDVLPPELAENTRYYIIRALDENLVQTYEYSLPSEDGLNFYESRMVKTEEDTVLAIVRDVTTRIKAKQMNEEMLGVLERRNIQLHIAANVSKTCSSILDPDILVQQAVNLIQHGFNLYYVGLYLIDAADKTAILIAGSGEAGKKMLANGHHLQIEEPSMIAWSIRNGKARIAQQAEMDEMRYPNPNLPETRSELALPMISRGRVIGALTVQDSKEGAFSESDISSLQAMADQLGTALENANLFEATQKEIEVRRAIENKLRVSEQKFSKAFHSSPDSVTLSEIESGLLIEVNDGFHEVFGYSREEAVGRTTLELGLYQNPEDRHKMVQTMRELGNIRNLELRGRKKSGAELTALISAEQIEMSGKPYLITITRDITERKRAEEEREQLINVLEEKNAELERFTYTVSHDLKSPLITIRGFLGYLEQDAVEGNIERLKTDIERISNAAGKMQQLLDELLELSRIGRLMNEPEKVSFQDIVSEALKLVEGRIKGGDIKIKVASNLPNIYVDRARLVEVVQNLVDNAAKFVKDQPNPIIEIGVRDKGDERIFYVKDNGIGIAPKYHEKIFGLFDKLDASSEGTGIGLSLVKRIVEVHGGRIWVESEAGKGAIFCFTLSSDAYLEANK